MGNFHAETLGQSGCRHRLEPTGRHARAQGETEQRIHALDAWREIPFFSARERAAPTLTETVTPVRDGQVPDAVYAEAVEVFEEEQIAALIWAATVINAYNRIAIATPTVPGAGSFYGAGSNEAQEMCLIRSGVCRRGSPNAEGR